MSRLPVFGALALTCLLTACGGDAAVRPDPPRPAQPAAPAPKPLPVKVGLALGGGAAKGFAHVGVIKMLEANGIPIDVVAGTSAGSVVGALYAGGIDPFELQKKAVALDEAQIRDVSLFGDGLIKGQKLQDYVNAQIGGKPLQGLAKPFAAVATRLDNGARTVFVRGNTGQAVRASSSVPGVFEPVTIAGLRYVDGGVVSPVPVDAARGLGADIVIAVNISSRANGQKPDTMVGIVNQSIMIMGNTLGAQELARADIVIRPRVGQIGGADFDQRHTAILEGERATVAALPQIKAKIAALRKARAAAAAPKVAPTPPPPPCDWLDTLGKWVGREDQCSPRK